MFHIISAIVVTAICALGFKTTFHVKMEYSIPIVLLLTTVFPFHWINKMILLCLGIFALMKGYGIHF